MPNDRMSIHDQWVMTIRLRKAQRLAALLGHELGSQSITDKPRDR